MGGLNFLEQKKKFFFGGEKISFFEKKMKKKIGKISENFFFDFFFDLHIEKYRFLELIQGKYFFFLEKRAPSLFWGTIGYLHAKFQKNLMSGYREKLVTD